MEDGIKAPKLPKSKIRVTFPNGESICYRHAKDTVIDVLRRIDPSKYEEIKFESNGVRLITNTVRKEDEKCKESICEGWWYLNKLANTDDKVYQLTEINRVFGLDLKIESGANLKVTNYVKSPKRSVRPKKKIRIRFKDGRVLDDDKYLVVFRDFVRYVGVDKIARREILWNGEPLVTTTNVNNNRAKLGENKWFLEPRYTKEAQKIISVIAAHCHINNEIEIEIY